MDVSTPPQNISALGIQSAQNAQHPTTTTSSSTATSTDRSTVFNSNRKEEISDGNTSSSGETKTTSPANSHETNANNSTNRGSLPLIPTATTTSGQNDFLRRLPDHVLRDKVLACFGYKDYTLASVVCQYLQLQWVAATENHRLPLYVPEDCRTLREAVNRVQGVVSCNANTVLEIDTNIVARFKTTGEYYSGESE